MIINLKSQTDLSGFYVIYEGSTNLEKPGWYGLSHLMEHLCCKSLDHLQDEFDRQAIDWNAYTSSNEIVFYLTGLDEKVNKYKNIFVKNLTSFKVTEEEFENERKIVLEEYMDYFNDQTQVHILNLTRKLFNYYDPIGLREDLENITYQDCLDFFELQYSKPTKIINVSKDTPYNDDTIEFQKHKVSTKLEFGNHDVPLELGNEFKDKTSLVVLSPIIEDDFAYVQFINTMLSHGLKSPLYQEVREKKGLVYYIHCYLSRINDKGVNTIATLTSNKNADEVLETIKSVINNPSEFLTQERFDIIKDYYDVRKKKDQINLYKNIGQYLSPDGWRVYDILDGLTFDKIKEVYAKYFDFDKFYVSTDKTEFVEELV